MPTAGRNTPGADHPERRRSRRLRAGETEAEKPDGFVDSFARRIAGFDKVAIAGTKALLDWALLPPDEEFGPGLAAFFRTSGRPENAARVRYLFDNGLQTPVGVELDLGRAVGEFAS